MAEHRSKNRRYEPTAEEKLAEGIFSVLSAIGRFILSLFFKKKSGAPKGAAYQQRIQQLQDAWAGVEMHAAQPAMKIMAIGEADKILDSALQLKGVSGNTMGERLKSATSLFPNDLYQSIWAAHKLRNQIAHEVHVNPSESDLNTALQTFHVALYHLGILQ